MKSSSLGFTLIEMMIVIAIIGILSAIALPNYRKMMKQANESACLGEAKNYSNVVWYEHNMPGGRIPKPTPSACLSITDASAWTDIAQIIAIPKTSDAKIICDVPRGTPCYLVP